jgi:hypothetical protein
MGVASEVETPKPLDREDGTGGEQLSRFFDHIITTYPFSACILQPDLGPAHRTRVRLCVETAVERIFVLLPARITHAEFGHGRIGSIVWDI